MTNRRSPLSWMRRDGKIPTNAIRFEPGQRVGLHEIVKKVGSWSGVARWQLRCPNGHYFDRSSSSIMRFMRGQKGPPACTECKENNPLDTPAARSHC